ncbi:MAG: 2-hydroxyacyl-CoA dehydratase [Spirochaetaceae bacterium]|nr:2-hydroxyacyl-CoA dehydratase [Spirochaetaceae bacterium]
MKLGLDIGSTTIKCILIDENKNILFETYKRHFSKIQSTTIELFNMVKPYLENNSVELAISGSAGMGMANRLKIPFVQEVYATRVAVLENIPDTDVVIELGGEDAKILFLKGSLEVRMNGTCAGGTGSFIDQMANLLNIPVEKLDDIAKNYTQTYSIASRCGVYAKGDVQPLINQGAEKSDIARSVFESVANQTVGGLAQGRPIKGNVVYLGGPLTFMSQLRDSLDCILKLKGNCPNHSLYYVSLGTAYLASEIFNLDKVSEDLKIDGTRCKYNAIEPLFNSELEIEEFQSRHAKASLKTTDPTTYKGDAYLGIDSGSTTIKLCIIDKEDNLIYTKYQSNNGDPVESARLFLIEFKENYPDINIKKSCSTGYGEELMKAAFNIEYNVVETMAHYRAAKHFDPLTDFIIDIGGQDIKCFKIENGVIDDIFLNEACSSGCGSFLQTFFDALGYTPQEATKLALTSRAPVDLGTRCTVFMNSLVKQAQKDGAKVEDIFAGLSISVVKNALYKVIRCNSASDLGAHIVTQGGTFLNDAVLRSFEQLLDTKVTRPSQAGIMGAFGCALYAKHMDSVEDIPSTFIDLDHLRNFFHKSVSTYCKGCTNNCHLTINQFSDGRKFTSGNNCERFVRPEHFIEDKENYNLYEFKRNYIRALKPIENAPRGKIGLPLALSMVELMPFYFKFFSELGYEVIKTAWSTRLTFIKGQSQIPSDTACYPAKLVHGHIQELIDEGIKTIIYPSSSYNIDEHKGDNNFNCPLVAYYPELIKHNTEDIINHNITFIDDFVSLHDRKMFVTRMVEILKQLGTFTKKEIKKASVAAYKALEDYSDSVNLQGEKIIEKGRSKNMPIIVLCGRPYHIDPELSHGIDSMLLQLGCVVVTEDSLSKLVPKSKRDVLNQWTYHTRMYDAAKFVTTQEDMNVLQLVSFGCGLDAVTTDEVKSILAEKGKIYTQVKIDEIANLGSVRIRARSLLEALKEAK